MSTLIQRTDQEILMSFVASCIEDVADKLGLDYAEVYERMKTVGMIDDYIIPHYDVLHTESRANVTAGMIETLKRWEGQKWAHLQSSVFKLSKDLIDSIHEEGIVAYTS